MVKDMAQKVTLVDDLDGTTETDMTLNFGLDGTEYEIDLGDANYEKYREALELLASKARVVTREPVKVKRTLSGKKVEGAPNKSQEMREWLRGQGYDVKDRGRVRQDLVDLWETRSRMPEKVEDTPVTLAEVKADLKPIPDVVVELVKDDDTKAEEAVIARVKSTPRTRKSTKKVSDVPALVDVLKLEV